MTIESPCIGLCQMDKDTGACRGCFRTLAEITTWSRASDAEKLGILQSVHQRRQGLDPWGAELRGDCDR